MIRTIIAIFAFIGASLGAALGGFGIVPALKKREPGWSDAGTVADLVVGRPQDAWLATWSRADAVVSHPIEPMSMAKAVTELLRPRVALDAG